MSVRKLSTGKWLCECYPNGSGGKRCRRQFDTKGEAVAFETYTMDQAKNKPWLGEKEDRRKLERGGKNQKLADIPVQTHLH